MTPYAPHILSPEVLEQMALYRREFDSKNVNYHDISELADVVDAICDCVARRQPYSMARIGDGEGACLFFREEGYRQLGEYVAARSLMLHFGPQDYRTEDLDVFCNEIAAAAHRADLVTFARKPEVHRKLVSEPEDDIRGFVGATYGDHFVSTLREEKGGDYYRDGYLHVALLPHYPEILAGQKVVTICSAQDAFIEGLSRHFQFELLGSVKIPDQAANVSVRAEDYLYPKKLKAVREAVQHLSGPGIIFLIAAGLAGKIFCVDVKEAGGIAIDVGSVMDVWEGKGVRGYQNSDFVRRHQIRW